MDGLEAGGFGSANGNQVRYLDTVGGELGPFSTFSVGGGWFAGANLQLQRVVIGVEASGNYESANFSTAAGSGGITNFFHFANINRELDVAGRVGWLTTPDTLLYIKAGPANMTLIPDTNYFNAIAPNVVRTTTFAGYVAGIGAETFLLPNFSVRAEAVYTHTDTQLVFNGLVPNEFSLQPSIFSATLGAAWHL